MAKDPDTETEAQNAGEAREGEEETELQEEEQHARRGRRSLIAARSMRAGERLTADAVKVVRPGVGLEPMLLEVLLGRPLTRDVFLDHPLSWDDFLLAK